MLRLFKAPYKVQSDYQVWEEGSHPQRIEDEAVMRQKLDYLHYNPVKRGYVDLPEHWRWSSARTYLGQPLGWCRSILAGSAPKTPHGDRPPGPLLTPLVTKLRLREIRAGPAVGRDGTM
jgi:hypothetical protein